MTELNHRLKTSTPKVAQYLSYPASDFHELVPGDAVVHFHNGIAKYLGIEKRPNNVGTPTEFMILEYAEGSKLFIPVSQSHLVSRYIGTKEEVPTLSQLGSTRWQKTRNCCATGASSAMQTNSFECMQSAPSMADMFLNPTLRDDTL